jgi:6-phosphofructokinase
VNFLILRIEIIYYLFSYPKGGYDLLGRTKDQIRTTEQVNAAMASCQALKLDGLVIIGGMHSHKKINYV